MCLIFGFQEYLKNKCLYMFDLVFVAVFFVCVCEIHDVLKLLILQVFSCIFFHFEINFGIYLELFKNIFF